MIVVYVKSVGVVITRSEKGDSDRGWYFQVLGWWQSRQPRLWQKSAYSATFDLPGGTVTVLLPTLKLHWHWQ